MEINRNLLQYDRNKDLEEVIVKIRQVCGKQELRIVKKARLQQHRKPNSVQIQNLTRSIRKLSKKGNINLSKVKKSLAPQTLKLLPDTQQNENSSSNLDADTQSSDSSQEDLQMPRQSVAQQTFNLRNTTAEVSNNSTLENKHLQQAKQVTINPIVCMVEPQQPQQSQKDLEMAFKAQMKGQIRDILQHYDVISVPKSFLEGVTLPQQGHFFMITPEQPEAWWQSKFQTYHQHLQPFINQPHSKNNQ